MKEERTYYVYILSNKKNGVLYIGVTNSIFARNFQHKSRQNQNSFTTKYNINKVIYFEIYQYVNEAIIREKQLKNWRRQWKIKLIEEENPEWSDLANDIK